MAKKILLKGSQEPRIRIEPHRDSTDGTGAAMLMQAYGYTLDEWQKSVVSCWLGKRSGAYNVTSAGLSVPRQNGKNFCLYSRVFYGLVINAERVIWTAHQTRTVKKAFLFLAALFEDSKHPDIKKLVHKIRYGSGEESIFLKNGASIEFVSRSRQAARGFDGVSLVIIDEAQEASEEAMQAVLATLAASTTGNRQIIYTGTPPYVGCDGEVFRRFREKCINAAGKGEEQPNAWHEWSIAGESIQGLDLSDRRLWYECNPSLGGRLTEEFTLEEYKTLASLGFAQERLGFWLPQATAKTDFAINAEAWDACKSMEPHPEGGKIAYGVKFSADGATVCLAGCIVPDIRAGGGLVLSKRFTGEILVDARKEPAAPSLTGEKIRITLLAEEQTGNGLQWLANWLNERYKQAACVVIDGRGGADVLIEKLQPSGGGAWLMKNSVIKPSTQNIVAAASMLINAVNERALTWYAEQDELRESAITATKRPIGGGFGFGGQTSTPIEACSLALYGATISKRNPQRKMLIG